MGFPIATTPKCSDYRLEPSCLAPTCFPEEHTGKRLPQGSGMLQFYTKIPNLPIPTLNSDTISAPLKITDYKISLVTWNFLRAQC